MWPNIFAPSFWTLTGIFSAHFIHHKHLKKQDDILDVNTPGGLKDIMDEVKKLNAKWEETGTFNKETQSL